MPAQQMTEAEYFVEEQRAKNLSGGHQPREAPLERPVADLCKPCVLCGRATKGSIGAAGIEWKCLCQQCKDKEDSKAAEASIRANVGLFNAIQRYLKV